MTDDAKNLKEQFNNILSAVQELNKAEFEAAQITPKTEIEEKSPSNVINLETLDGFEDNWQKIFRICTSNELDFVEVTAKYKKLQFYPEKVVKRAKFKFSEDSDFGIKVSLVASGEVNVSLISSKINVSKAEGNFENKGY